MTREQAPTVTALDHLVLTVSSIDAARRFYEDVMGMAADTYEAPDGTTRTALRYGVQKINLHEAGAEFSPHAARPTPGSADLCFLTDRPLEDWRAHLRAQGVALREDIVPRTGARGPMHSIYTEDPDGNLIEISRYS